MNGLTEAEREELRAACWYAFPYMRIEAAVEAIVAARLASVEALADEWDDPWSHTLIMVGQWETRQDCAVALRAVLGSDAHAEACGATYHGHACTLHVGHTSNHLSRDENVNPVASWHDAHTEQKGTGE